LHRWLPDLEEVYLEESNALRAMRGLMNAHMLLDAGFTTIRDVGNSGDITSSLA